MNNYNKINNILGWIILSIASYVYLSTIEPTASFWDCGEYILSCYKLEVGHPPGAPFFVLLGRLFIVLFGGSSVENVAAAVNIMSALSSAFTILFLFWSITAIARKMAESLGEMSDGKMWAVFGSGIVGSLAYTFSDSFWFSAVEGEVYALSSLLTAIVFWSILKWERIAHEPHSNRWLVFIAYIIGISIGVHLLNLLAIPAIVFVYYFKKYERTPKGMILTLLLSVAILGVVMKGIIPGIVKLSAKFELLFVNSFGLPFNMGTIVYFILILIGIVWGLNYTYKKSKPVWNTIIVCFTVLLIGYSSFFILVIRSLANPPMDENNPENAITLLSYLQREQYGDWPILKGQYYNSPLDANNPYSDGNPVYMRNDSLKKYIITDDRKNENPNYDSRFTTIFPRMWSQQSHHERAYKTWGDVVGTSINYDNPYNGKTEVIVKPTFFENIRYFIAYQVKHMYFRYFMWNFAGRQNDIQGHGIEYTSSLEGNWISGFKWFDENILGLGPQDNLPDSVTKNKGNNKFYFLPLILGLIGLWFHFKHKLDDAIVVLLLFLLTGLAIVVYLNQYPYQPRERDYAYAGSFYAFAIWIGLGVYALYELLHKIKNEKVRAISITCICLIAVPSLMASEGWDDHNRSKRYTCVDFAANYLNSCEKNAILFTNGDNDTFPLWYAQEVEGIRTDVRVVNLSLANTDWYIDQLRRKAYDSDPVKLTLSQDKYWQGHRDWVPIREQKGNVPKNIKSVIKFIGSENHADMINAGDNMMNYMPTKNLYVPVDSLKVLKNGTVSVKDTAFLLKNLEWSISKSYLLKSDLLVLDIIASNNWERPVYFSVTTGSDAYLNLQPYFQLEGLAYRLVPLKPDNKKPLRINTEIMYKNMMEKYRWGGLDKNEVYMDENNVRMAQTFRMQMITLANEYIRTNQKEKALKVLKRQLEVLPENNLPYFYEPYEYSLYLSLALYEAGGYEDANKVALSFFESIDRDMKYYLNLSGKQKGTMMREVYRKTDMMNRIISSARMAGQAEAVKALEQIFKQYEVYLAPEQPEAPPMQ